MITDETTDMATSHSTWLSKDGNQVAGYNPAKDAGQVIGYGQATKLLAIAVLAGHPNDGCRMPG